MINEGPFLWLEREAMAARIDAYGSVFGEQQFVNAETGAVEEFVLGWKREADAGKMPAVQWDFADLVFGLLVVALAMAVGSLIGGGQ